MWLGWQSWPGRPRPWTRTLTTETWNVAMLGEGARACVGGGKAPARAGQAPLNLHAAGTRPLERGSRSTLCCVLILNGIFLYSEEFHTNNRKPKTFLNSPLHHHVCSMKILFQFSLYRPFLYTFTVCIVFKTAFNICIT